MMKNTELRFCNLTIANGILSFFETTTLQFFSNFYFIKSIL